MSPLKTLSITIPAIILVCLAIIFAADIRFGINRWLFDIQKADDASRYATLKQVEDTARSMIASYQADRLTWEQYRDAADPQQQSWGEQARIRANRTSQTYNEFIRKNSFRWRDALPADIDRELNPL